MLPPNGDPTAINFTGAPDGNEEFSVDPEALGALEDVAANAGTVLTQEVSATLASEQGEGADRSKEVFGLTRDPETYRVTIRSELTRADYQNITSPKDWALLEKMAEPLKGKRVVFINPTMEGGGVAMLRPTLVHMLNELGVDAHWYVMAGPQDPAQGDPFIVTKTMHNIAHRRTAPGVRLTEDGKALHHRWAVEENGPVLLRQEPIRTADIVVIDDPQPAPLIRPIKGVNPDAKFVWRNHIDTNGELMANPTTAQGEVASYILDECGVREVDAVFVHPDWRDSFAHPEMADKTYRAPATIDPFDNLNRHLPDHEVAAGIKFINDEIDTKNAEFQLNGRPEDLQGFIEEGDELITLIARFDESKGMDKAMDLGVRARRDIRTKMEAAGASEEDIQAKLAKVKVVIVGNGSVDDPSGVPMFEQILKLRREEYPADADKIIVMRLKHNYDAMNALMRRSHILMQTSDAEGCETRISDGRNHGLPAVISNRGGMSMQLLGEGKSARILDYDHPDHDLDRGAAFIADLLTDPEKYDEAVMETLRQASQHNRREFGTVANVMRFARVFGNLLASPQREADKIWLISEMVERDERRTGAIGAVAI
jgi:hypothetical protein